jgi:hypothetical protein
MYQNAPGLFLKKTIPSASNWLGDFTEHQLTINVRVYFKNFSSVPLIDMQSGDHLYTIIIKVVL